MTNNIDENKKCLLMEEAVVVDLPTPSTLVDALDYSDVKENDILKLYKPYYSLKKINLNLSGMDVGLYSDMSNMFRKACVVVLANLSVCISKNRPLAYKMDKNAKTESERTNPQRITHRMLLKVFKQLEDDGWVRIELGKDNPNPAKRTSTRIYPTDELKQLMLFVDKQSVVREDVETQPVIILRDKDKNAMEWQDTEFTDSAAKAVTKFNLLNLEQNWLAPDGESMIQSNNRRIFNRTFAQGGRWYGSEIQQVKQKENGMKKPVEQTRLGVTVNGKPIVEVDYCCLHPTILAIQQGYDVGLVYGTDIYQVLVDNIDNPKADDRGLMKLALNIMLNAESSASAMKSIQSKINWEKKHNAWSFESGAKVWAHIFDLLPFMQPAFNSEISAGLELQFIDSEIADYIATVFTEAGKPCAIIHDSFAVAEEDEELLCKAMGEAFRYHVEYDGEVMIEVKRADGSKEKLFV